MDSAGTERRNSPAANAPFAPPHSSEIDSASSTGVPCKGMFKSLVWSALKSHYQALFRRRAQKNIGDRKSTRLNSSHGYISYAVFCLKKKKIIDYAYDRLI